MSKVPTAAECYYEDVRARIGTTSEYARASSRGASTAVRSIVVKPVDPARIRAMEEGLENARRDLERRGYTTWDHVEVESKQTASYCPYCGSHIPSKYG